MGVTKETISPGDGTNFPKPGDKLTMHYHGTLAANGQKFDASRDRGRPFQFTIGVGQVIRGWDDGVMQMVNIYFFILAIIDEPKIDTSHYIRGSISLFPPLSFAIRKSSPINKHSLSAKRPCFASPPITDTEPEVPVESSLRMQI